MSVNGKRYMVQRSLANIDHVSLYTHVLEPAGNAEWRPPLTERALAALTDRAASRLAHTLSKYVSPSVRTKCGSRPYSICRTAPDGVVMSWHD